MTDEEFEDFRRRWAESHRGVSNAHTVRVLNAPLRLRVRLWLIRVFRRAR